MRMKCKPHAFEIQTLPVDAFPSIRDSRRVLRIKLSFLKMGAERMIECERRHSTDRVKSRRLSIAFWPLDYITYRPSCNLTDYKHMILFNSSAIFRS